ncbi:MAG: glycosyltransferase [Sedimentisphaerales bacterium]
MTQAVPRAASTLQEMGYTITILSLDKSGDKHDHERVNDWEIIWYHHKYKSGNKISFLWAWLCWWVWVIRKIYRGNYDLVQASNLESIVPCVFARKFRKFTLVLDIRDLWGMACGQSYRRMMRIFNTMERWAAKRVDGIVLCPAALERLAEYFGKKVAQSIPTVQVLNVPAEDIAGTYSPPPAGQIRFNYSGHISYLRNAQAILDLASEKPEVQVDVVGEIHDDKLRIAFEAIPNVKLYGQLPFKQAMEVFLKANLISIMYDSSTEIAIISTPNKMFEAMMMSRPYIASSNSFPGITAEKHSLGWAVPYGNSRALIELVSELQGNPSKIESAAKNARKTYEKYFTWDKQKANLIMLYNYVTNGEKIECFSHAGWNKMLGTVLQNA